MAQQLIDSLSSEFEPEQLPRRVPREGARADRDARPSGEEIAVQPEAPEPAKVPDLMAALEASLAAVKDRRGGQEEEGRLGLERLRPRAARSRSRRQRRSACSPSRTTPACAGCGRRPSGPPAPRRARGPSPTARSGSSGGGLSSKPRPGSWTSIRSVRALDRDDEPHRLASPAWRTALVTSSETSSRTSRIRSALMRSPSWSSAPRARAGAAGVLGELDVDLHAAASSPTAPGLVHERRGGPPCG